METMKPQQTRVLIVAILASFVAFLDGSVVNVALPAIVNDLGGGLPVQQWIVDAYLITLGALMLLAGSLSDLLGRRKILQLGLMGFGVASVLCAVAPTSGVLIGARALQGVAGALLVPSSLALIVATFKGAAQGRAIGTWTAWTGMAFLFGPLLGGLFVDSTSWRLIFAINVVPIALTLWLVKNLPIADRTIKRAPLDITGALLGAGGIGLLVYGLIEQSRLGWENVIIQASLIVGLALISYFLVYEQRYAKNPMLPMQLFSVRNFSVGNAATLSIYAGLSIATFLLTIFVQQVGDYSATQAGLALIPVTLIMFVLSPRFGGLAGRYGPRWFMGMGPVVAAFGFLLMLRVNGQVEYWTQLFPGILVFGLGLSITVSPLTTAVLSSIKSSQAGIASAVNNMIARIAGLVGIAVIGTVTGTRLSVEGFHDVIVLTALLLLAGGIISMLGIQNPPKKIVNTTEV